MVQIFVISILIILAAVLSTRLYMIRKNLIIFKKELESFDGVGYRKNLSVICGSRSAEELAITINRKTAELKDAVDHYRSMENELKQSIASMSHDLRTPLTAIMGYLQLMKNETEKSGIGEYLEIASRRAKMLETLINDFFEISMIEVHQFPISIEAVELNSVLAQHIADYYNNFLNKGIQLKVDIQEQPVKIMADKNALDRIITNLIGNAYEHSSTEVSIRLYEDEKTAAFEISNYADNLSIEDTQKIFDRFFMADKVRNGQSSGLGLSIVKALIEKINGTITASYNDSVLTMKASFVKSNV